MLIVNLLAASNINEQIVEALLGKLVVLKVAMLHQNLTNDLKSPTVNLKRILNDAQVFVAEAASVASAADALAKATNPTAASTAPAN